MRYATKQRKLLLDVLEAHHDETLSVAEICSLVASEEISPSAIYRNLSELEKQGLVKRVPLPLSQKTGFRYVGSNQCREHLHLECTMCGRTFHLPTPATSQLIENVRQNSGFKIDSANTFLTGVCPDCEKH